VGRTRWGGKERKGKERKGKERKEDERRGEEKKMEIKIRTRKHDIKGGKEMKRIPGRERKRRD
jgi:hypothetical protein